MVTDVSTRTSLYLLKEEYQKKMANPLVADEHNKWLTLSAKGPQGSWGGGAVFHTLAPHIQRTLHK